MRALLFLCVILLGALSSALAAPRVGQHEGYTRTVLDLPRSVTYRVEETSQGLRVHLEGLSLPAESGALSSRELSAFRIHGESSATVYTLEGRGSRAPYKVFLLEGGGQGVRLVVDYGPGLSAAASTAAPAAPTAPKTAPANPSPSAGASVRAPTRPKLRVVLDPGHGGIDSGMVGYVTEKVITLDVAQRVRKLLEARGVEVILTRDRDMHLSADKATDLGMRARMANAGTVNAFVSIHVNAGPKSASGIETYVFGKPLEASTRSIALRENGGGSVGEKLTQQASNLAQNLLGDLLAQSNLAFSKTLANKIQSKAVAATGAINRGVKSDYFYVIRYARTPAILVELGFGSHPTEGRRLATESYRQTLAQAIADGLLEFLHVR
ncbi:N-acetylmuramoyl-L-alanine amidase [Deinobacterium chartae]|uniref:N-acetylmuramoyl-L-alanine amidase n=1 Tax=Deinobacterium chartae TaxID=521158 RepID=A0A841HYS7_9DEIO|nr:N-acetylmuramoyl-L-alanine amidase [Deinobacterium chartae]MBB6098547.1 N-acetylmuramoyl-L-alanine amidase [Deinobacterium chartae]